MFGSCWFLICSTVLYTETENMWSTRMVCLDWLHKYMILCNPDLWSYFSLFWSILFFAFNQFRQAAGQLPGAISQMVSFVDPHRSAYHHLTVLQECLVSFLLPYPWSQAVLAHAKRPAVEAGEVLPEAQRAGSGSVFSSLTHWAFPIWHCRLSSSQEKLITFILHLQACLPVPYHLEGVIHIREAAQRRSSKQDFWWLYPYLPLQCAFGKSFEHAFHQVVFLAPKWGGFLSRVMVKSSTSQTASTAHWLSTRLTSVQNQVY